MIKRYALSIICIVMMIPTVLSGCSLNINNDKDGGSEGSNDIPGNQSKYQVLVYDYSDSVPSVKHEVEYEFADHEKYDDDSKTKDRVELSVGENTYRGDFQSRQYRGYNYYPTNMYLDSENNNFEIDDAGMLTFFFRGETSSEGAVLSQDACLQIAKDFLGDIIDISQYDIGIEYEGDTQKYRVKFTKHINGIKAADTATVVLHANGELYSYSSFMLGKVSTESVIGSIDMEGVKESVNNKLDQLFVEAKKIYSRVEYREPSFLLTVLKDGSTGLICTVEVNCIHAEGEYNLIMSERINFVVIVGNTL